MAPFRLIQVGEMAEAVPGLVRAGRPRSQEAFKPSLAEACGRDAHSRSHRPFFLECRKHVIP